MTVRSAVSDDVKRVRAIAEAAYIRYVPRIGRRPAPMDADFQAHIARGEVTLALVGEKIAGYVIAFPRADDYFVENVAVDPVFAGKGVGKALMAVAEKAAIAAGKRFVRLYTNMRMHENFPFYFGLGYVKTHEVTESGFHRAYFEKELPARA